MSMTCLRKCRVNDCKFNIYPKEADLAQMKLHLGEHDYKELQAAAFECGLIDSSHTRRSRKWFMDSLALQSKVEEEIDKK